MASVEGQKIAILVAGMHRSGTSALTRTLNLLGCDLPKTLIPPRPDNEWGFWESQAIIDLNEDILASAGSAWDDWTPFSPAWYASPVIAEFRERAQAVLEREFGPSKLFILKDPRICRLLGFWVEAVEGFGAVPHVVSPIRNPLEVAASLEKRNGLDPSVAQLFWLRHVLDAEAASRHVTRSYVRYDELLAQWQTVADRISADVGTSWPRLSTSAAREIEEFLSSGRRHHVDKDENVLRNPSISPWIGLTFETLDRWAQGKVRETDVAELDRVRIAFDAAVPAFSRAIAAGQDAARKSWALEKRLAAREARAGELARKLETEEARAGELARKLEAEEARAGKLVKTLEATETRAGELANELGAVYASYSWRITGPLRAIRTNVQRKTDRGRVAKTIGRFAQNNGFRAVYRLFRQRRLVLSSGAFDADYYRGQYPDVAAARIDPALHYLLDGAREGRDPNPLFDTDWYLKRNPDVAEAGVNPLVHYVRSGASEGRSPNSSGRSLHLPVESKARPSDPALSRKLPSPKAWISGVAGKAEERSLRAGNPSFDAFCHILGRAPAEVARDLANRKGDLEARLKSGVLGEMVARAGELEPLIHHPSHVGMEPRIPPFVSKTIVVQIVAMHRLQKSVSRRRARAIVVIPHCRLSGATRVAGHLATELANLYGRDEVVVLRTDRSDMRFPEWFPDGCRHADFAGASQDMGLEIQQRLFVEFLRSLRPVAVFNVNSRLFWDTMRTYGRALSSTIALYTYLFCSDQDIHGHSVGYPVELFYRCFDDFRAVMTDSHYLAKELRTRFQIPPVQADKLTVLETPISNPRPLAPCPSISSATRRQIFWAGRFDRQKRVDVVFALASRLPEVDFHLWGEPVLDKDFKKYAVPGNIFLKGVYRDFNELPLERCDLWLYTSQWDGVPNILLDVVAAGVPLVASLVGGTGEVLVEGLCHRIPNVEDIDAFEVAIRNVLDDPTTARGRAAQLREVVLARRTPCAYRTGLEKLLPDGVCK